MSRRQIELGISSLAVVWLVAASDAHAYRPFDGTDADVAEFGEFELELGPLEAVHDPGATYLLAPATVLNLGILPRTELVLDFVSTIAPRPAPGERGFQLRDTDVFLKFLLVKGALQQRGHLPSVALETGPSDPRGQW